MKYIFLILLLAAGSADTNAQTQTKAKAAQCRSIGGSGPCQVKLPPGVPPGKGAVKTAFALRYLDIRLGAGAEAEPNEIYQINYTGWLGVNGRPDDGREFDSSYDRPGLPLYDKNGKAVMGPDGTQKLGDPMPMSYSQGRSRGNPGFDQGFTGMRAGGKRRLFIPWQLGYGAQGHAPVDPVRSVIPPKSDLIYDIELVAVPDASRPPNGTGMSK
jgi:peptidylprolyl isomerase